MNRAVNTYWDDRKRTWRRRNTNSVRRPDIRPNVKQESTKVFTWRPAAIALFITLSLCLTVNYRAFSELRSETNQYESLQNNIESTTSKNLALQEEIYYLKSDPDMIKREAQKFGFVPRSKKVPGAGQ